MFHFQRTVTDWPRAVAQLPPGSLIKAVDQGDILRDAKVINPGVITMLRHVGGPQAIFWGDFEFNKQLARDFFETFVDETFRTQYAQHTDLVQEWNEYIATSDNATELQQRLTWAEAAAWVWKHEYRTQEEYKDIRLALCSIAVGNDLDRRFAEIAIEYDCVLSYHGYDKFIGDHVRDPLSWRYHSGRWHYMEEAWGLKPDWVFGEAGPYAGVLEGWRHPSVLNGDRGAYVEAVRTWIREIKGTPAYQEGRVKGFALFTTGRTEGDWDFYYTEQPELDQLAAMIAQEWTPPPPPEPLPMDWKREVIEESERRQQATGIRFNPTYAYIRWMVDNGYAPANSEGSFVTGDGVKRQLQGAVDLTGEKDPVTLVYEGAWGGMSKVEILPHSYLDEVPEPFAFRVWPTDYKTITQIAGNNTAYYGQISPHFAGHEGLDIRAPLGAPVYSVDSGVVSDLRQAGDAGHAYGRFIRVRHSDGYESTYGHLQSISVVMGQAVSAGQEIGRADNTGNIVSGSSHLHLTLKLNGVIVDPTPFVLSHKPDFPGLPPALHGVTVCDVSQHQGAIDFHKMLRRGVHGAYVRGSIGATGLDARFPTNWRNVGQTTLLRGMYHLFRSDATPRQNLDNIKRTVDEYGPGHWRVALDVEPLTNLPRVNGDRVRQLIDLFTAEMGYAPLIYTGTWIIPYTDGDKSWFASSLLWLASYWQTPPQTGQFPQLPAGSDLSRLLIHQWTSSYFSGGGFGVASTGLDVNIVYDLGRLRP